MKSPDLIAIVLVSCCLISCGGFVGNINTIDDQDGSAEVVIINKKNRCVIVSSVSSWIELEVRAPINKISDIKGGWTIDHRNYMPVGPDGHRGTDAELLRPHDRYKYYQNAPFGALLIAVGDLTNVKAFPENSDNLEGKKVFLRINDKEMAFGDNKGELTVCFE